MTAARAASPPDLERERAGLDAAVAGKTLCDILLRNATTYGSEPALFWRHSGNWRSLTWQAYRQEVVQVGMGLKTLGVTSGDSVAIMARNRPEHLIADLGALHARATPVSFYNTSSSDQICFIASHCDARVAFVEERFLDRWQQALSSLKSLEHVIVIREGGDAPGTGMTWKDLKKNGRESLESGRDDFESEWKKLNPEDPATIIYTSGTTGHPKGVIVTNHNALWTAASTDQWGTWPSGFKYLSYLPLAHSLERLAAHYVCMWKAARVYFCPEITEVFDFTPEVRPYAFVAVPRLWEKLETAITAALSEEPNARKRAIAARAIHTGREAVRLTQDNMPLPALLRLRLRLLDRLVLKKIRAKIGLDDCGLPLSGAAPLSPEVLEFFFAIGLPITEGYGMTESTAPATINPPARPRIGTVGPPLPGVEVALGEDGELLIRGGNISPGYHKDEELTRASFDADGWLHSGDIARIDDDGYVTIVDRKKELIITAGGKNVSPAHLENMLKRHPLVSQACVVGDRKPYLAALIILDPEASALWAKEQGLRYADLKSIAETDDVRHSIQQTLDDVNRRVSNAEGIKQFAILAHEWTADGDELTPTLKLKRRAIHEKYAREIKSLYA